MTAATRATAGTGPPISGSAVGSSTATTITRRSGLPRGRAVLGGFLVAFAAVIVFAAYRRAEAPPATSYVTVTRDIAPGEVLTEADLALVAVELPEAQSVGVHTRVEDVAGAVATDALAADELLARGDVRSAQGYRAPVEVAFPMPISTALAGSTRAGERVDVLATYGSGPDATTMRVVRDALIVSQGSETALGGADVVTVRLGVASSSEALAVTHAAAVADVVLVRGGASDMDAPPYRPFAAGTTAPDGAEPPGSASVSGSTTAPGSVAP